MVPLPTGQWDNLWPAPQEAFPRRLRGARGLLRKRSKVGIRREPVGSGSRGARRTKTASSRGSMR